jgi:hypothetical protein
MEQFFTSTRPLRHGILRESPPGEAPFECNEVQLAVSVEDFLICNWDWKDLRAVLTDDVTPKVLWITEHAFIKVNGQGHFHVTLNECVTASFQEASGLEQSLFLVHPDRTNATISLGVAGVFWRAITTSNCVQLRIGNCYSEYEANSLVLPSAPLLSKFLRGNLSLRHLEFDDYIFEEEHCRALATLQRTDLKVKFTYCTIQPRNEEPFIEWFRNSQVVTELECCTMESSILSALSGNISVKKIAIFEPSAEEIRSLAWALQDNLGIEHLCLNDPDFGEATWSLFFGLLATHPRIKLLTLREGWTPNLSAESKRSVMNAILQMLRLNTVVHTIELPDQINNEAMYQNAILPRLQMNRTSFEVQRQAVKRADPSIRPQLLGRALHAVRCNPNLVFQFLSENVPAFVRTEEEEDSTFPFSNDPAIVSGQKRKAP